MIYLTMRLHIRHFTTLYYFGLQIVFCIVSYVLGNHGIIYLIIVSQCQCIPQAISPFFCEFSSFWKIYLFITISFCFVIFWIITGCITKYVSSLGICTSYVFIKAKFLLVCCWWVGMYKLSTNVSKPQQVCEHLNSVNVIKTFLIIIK